MRSLVLPVLILLCGAAAAENTPEYSVRLTAGAEKTVRWPDCYCLNRGTRVEIGDLSCLTVGGRSFLALCDMSLNNPAWRDTGEGCPSS